MKRKTYSTVDAVIALKNWKAAGVDDVIKEMVKYECGLIME